MCFEHNFVSNLMNRMSPPNTCLLSRQINDKAVFELRPLLICLSLPVAGWGMESKLLSVCCCGFVEQWILRKEAFHNVYMVGVKHGSDPISDLRLLDRNFGCEIRI